MPAETEGAAVLCLGRDAQQHAAVQRADRHFGAEERLAQRQRHLAPQVGALAREHRMRQDADLDVRVGTLGDTREADALAIGDAGRNVDLDAAAVDLEQSLGAVGDLLEADLGLRLEALAGHAAVAGRGRSRATQTTEEVLDRAGPRSRSGLCSAATGLIGAELDVAAEEGAEEVTEAGQVLGVAAVFETDSAAARVEAAEATLRLALLARRPPAPAFWYACQLLPSWSYSLRFSGSDRTSLASLISLKRFSAAALPLLTSGWCSRASLRKAFLISALLAPRGTPSVA